MLDLLANDDDDGTQCIKHFVILSPVFGSGSFSYDSFILSCSLHLIRPHSLSFALASPFVWSAPEQMNNSKDKKGHKKRNSDDDDDDNDNDERKKNAIHTTMKK